MNVNELLVGLDNARRTAGRNFLSLVSDPIGHLSNSLARYARENLPTQEDVQDARSVMPGMSNALSQKITTMALGNMMPLATVWHGSPHVFDKFDMNKVGTGQGAQAYGYGLYFADRPVVGRSYKDMLADTVLTDAKGNQVWKNVKGFDADKATDEENAARIAANALEYAFDAQSSSPYALAAKSVRTNYPRNWSNLAEGILADWQGAGVRPKKAGALYKVDLPDEHIEKMLDWDKPLSQQTQTVRDALHKAYIQRGFPLDDKGVPLAFARDPSGEGLHAYLSSSLQGKGDNTAGQAAAAQALRSLGVSGIRYLDAGSRGATGTGKWKVSFNDGTHSIMDFKPNDATLKAMGATAEPHGTYNYVVFDDSIPKILERK